VVIFLMGAAGAAGYLVGHHSPSSVESAADSDSDDSVQPVPTVDVVPIQRSRIEQKMTAYGMVTAQPADMTIVSVPFEARVRQVLVAPGERLSEAAPVIEIEPSTDTQLQMLQARAAMKAATLDARQTRQRFNDHLATNQDLLQSEQNLQLAQLKLNSLEKQGAGGVARPTASGLVARVDVQAGQIVPAGAPLLEMAVGDKLQVRLGVEPSAAAEVHPGDPAAIKAINSDAPPVDGKVLAISQRISPDTRLTDVTVSLPAGAAMPLDASVSGELTLSAADGLVVPRSAVLPGDDGYFLFTVDHDKAVEHKVALGVGNDDSVQIVGEGLAAGQVVVVVGNLELDDGMTVKTEDAPAIREAAP
jgi:membrane fusion protein, multidrug efflux system